MTSKPTPRPSKKIETLPNDWGVRTLNDCLEKIIDHRGLTPLKLGGKWANTGLRAISARNVKDGRLIAQDSINFVDNQLYKKWMPDEIERDDILLTSEGPLGECMIWKSTEKIVISQRIFGLRAKKSIIFPDFLYWYIRSNIFQHELLSRQTGTTVQGIRQSELQQTQVRVPSFSEQKNIAKILTDLENKIECNIKTNELLEAICQAIFKHWFIDFEFPDEQGSPCKSSGGKMVDSELGAIPEGWNITTISEISEVRIGRTPPRKESNWFSLAEGVKWASIKDLGSAEIFILNTSERLTEEAVKKFKVPIIKEGTIMLSFKLTLGRVAIASEDMVSNEAIAHFNLKKVSMVTSYLFGYLNNYDYNLLGSTSSIATAINSDNIRTMKILVPPKYLQVLYDEILNPLFRKVKQNVLESKKIEDIRDLLLPKLMSGKIRVSVPSEASGSA